MGVTFCFHIEKPLMPILTLLPIVAMDVRKSLKAMLKIRLQRTPIYKL